MSQQIREYYEIAAVVPLEDEIIPFMGVFPSLEDRSTATSFCHVVDSGNSEIRMIVTQQQAMGRTAASMAAGSLLAQYDIGIVICLGIAGSLSDDVGLADICYTGDIIDVLDNAKVVDAEPKSGAIGSSDTEFSPTHYETPLEFTAAFNFMRTQPALRPAYLAWQCMRAAAASTHVPTEVR